MKIHVIKDLINEGQTSQALESIKHLKEEDFFVGEILKSKILIEENEFETARKLLIYILEISQTENNKVGEFTANSLLCLCLILQENVAEAQKFIQRGKHIINSMSGLEKEESEEFSGITSCNRGWVEIYVHILGESDDPTFKGELDLAIGYYNEAIRISKKHNNLPELARAFYGLGTAYQYKGEFGESLIYFQNSIDISQKRGHLLGVISANGSIGHNYLLQGKLDKSLHTYEKNLKIIELQNIKDAIDPIASFRVMGRIYFIKGNLEQALNFLKKGLNYANEFQITTEISCCLFNLILTSLESGMLDEATTYNNTLENLVEKNSMRIIKLRSKLANALILKSHKRAKYKIDAQRILESLIREKINTSELNVFSMFNLCTQQELTVFAMLNLTELLIAEFQQYGENEVLEEAEQLSNKIYTIAQDQKSQSLIVKTMILQTHYASIKGDFKKAETLLDQAYFITQEQGLEKLNNEVLKQREDFIGEVDRISMLAKQGASIFEREESSRLESYLTNTLAYLKDLETD
ncbi:MAG: hypothetical protein HeimC2_31770 [Candidatus Heimdallarchaeota archaeon LC_2]|nr:MAG: hypothetical protein HeimC2_31770 [Candidatus Heimdallarchaeota archaeon LC_2]